MSESAIPVFGPEAVLPSQDGPLYLRLRRWIEQAIAAGSLRPGQALPSERDLAALVEVSRVTVRRAIEDLVRDGVLVQRHGSGTYVAPPQRVEQSLSELTSFTEDMARRNLTVSSVWLERGLFVASPEETMTLGLSPGERVARINRLRLANDVPLAIEHASLSAAVLPDPQSVDESLYALLETRGLKPVRAMQRIRAAALNEHDAHLLGVAAGSATLLIERVAHLASGRVVEFTRSAFRGDAYDFIAEMRVGEIQ